MNKRKKEKKLQATVGQLKSPITTATDDIDFLYVFVVVFQRKTVMTFRAKADNLHKMSD